MASDRQIDLRLQVFFVVAELDETNVVGIEIDGQDWILLYSSLELAELYLEQYGGPFALSEVRSLERLVDALAASPGISGFVLNSLFCQTSFQFLDRKEVLDN